MGMVQDGRIPSMAKGKEGGFLLFNVKFSSLILLSPLQSCVHEDSDTKLSSQVALTIPWAGEALYNCTLSSTVSTWHLGGLGLDAQWFSIRDSKYPSLPPRCLEVWGESFVVTMDRLLQSGLQVWELLEFSSQGASDATYPIMHRTVPLEEEVSL